MIKTFLAKIDSYTWNGLAVRASVPSIASGILWGIAKIFPLEEFLIYLACAFFILGLVVLGLKYYKHVEEKADTN